MSREILIDSPAENNDIWRRFTSGVPLVGTEAARFATEDSQLDQWLADGLIDPVRFPRAVDLFAGDGSWAHRLVERGWKAEDVTCIDMARTNTPLVDGVDWVHLDLDLMAQTMMRNERLSAEVNNLRGKFDLAFMSYGRFYMYRGGDVADDLAAFFVRKGGLVYVEQDLHRKGKNGKLISLD
jgi:hypothetical protein